MTPAQKGRPRLQPDPHVRAAILDAALAIAHEQGVQTLNVAHVLDRAQLSTRAFYRNFDSKDDLVTAMFLELARTEAQRLREHIADKDPVRAVAAWINRRLDFFSSEPMIPSLGHWSLEAHSRFFASPAVVVPALNEILRPLIDEIDRGIRQGQFVDGDPTDEAMSIHGIVWANLVMRWIMGGVDMDSMQPRILGFCLRGLGVADEVVDDVITDVAKPR